VSKLKIIHLLASYKWTGPAEGVVTLCRDLKQRGHEVRLFCTPNSRRLLADRAIEQGVTPENGLRLARKHPVQFGLDVRRLKEILIRDRPDILHLHQSTDHWIGALAARWAKGSTCIEQRAGAGVGKGEAPSGSAGGGGMGALPIVVRTIHHPRTIERRPFRSWLYESLTDGFVTICENDRERLRRTYRIDPKPVTVIHGAVDTTRFHSDAEARLGRAEFGIKMTTPVVGMVARFQPHRGHELLIRTMPRLQTFFPTIRLLLVGRGEHQPVLERVVRELNLERCVVFTGYRDRDLPQIYAAMDVAVLLASGRDGSCRAALEAMAVGRPVVGFPVGALPETIVEGVTGHLIPQGNAENLAECLAALLSDRPRSQAMGEAARKRIEAEFTEEIRLKKTEAFYFSLTGN